MAIKINEQIRTIGDCRVIGNNGEQLGIMSIRQALNIAREMKLDLVEVVP
jgi:translation initiation factor IF-3